VRDTIITVLILGGLVSGYMYYTEGGIIGPQVGTPFQGSTTLPNIEADKGMDAYVNASQGVQNDYESDQGNFDQDADSTEDEGSADQVAKSKSLYSIYKRKKESRITQPSDRHQKSNHQKKSKSKVVHGVPVEDWVLAQQDNILLPAVSPNAEDGLRVFFQCLEIKRKGPEYLEKNECKALLVRRSTDRGNSMPSQ